MAKKQKHNKSSSGSAQSAAAIYNNGLKAFQHEDYSQAIATWSRIPPAQRPMAALAEAYFRQGTRQFYGPNPLQEVGLSNLQTAADYQPEDPVYAYHLGLAYHRLGVVASAVPAYRVARRTPGKIAARAAYPLALALTQQGQDPSTDTDLWAALAPAERQMLQAILAFRRPPVRLPPDAPVLWQALADLDAGHFETARTGLNQSLAAATHLEQGLARYYLGVLSARAENWEAARREWGAAYAAGLRSEHLRYNLAEGFHRFAEDCLSVGDVEVALAAAGEAARHQPEDRALKELLAQIHQQLGYQAALANRWPEAQKHWLAAAEADAPSFRLAYNLALAYERSEDYTAAADAWRTALARRPRRPDHPDALSAEQAARLWRHVAETHRKAGEGAQAIHAYQSVIKKDPDNLDLRLALAETLLQEERLAAAQNELGRILERNPDHIPALMRMGETLFHSDQFWNQAQAERYWQKVLTLQPDHPQARQALADYYRDRGDNFYSWENIPGALKCYQDALQYQPNQPVIRACIAGCYLRLEGESAAQEHVAWIDAHAPQDLDALDALLKAPLEIGRDDLAWKWMDAAEARIPAIPGLFYLAQASKCFELGRSELARPWLERAVARATPNENILLRIGQLLIRHDRVLARTYLERAVAAGQGPGEAHMMLTLIALLDGDKDRARQHRKQAERIAQAQHNEELLKAVQSMGEFFDLPTPMLGFLLQAMGSPEAMQEMVEELMGEDDDFWDSLLEDEEGFSEDDDFLDSFFEDEA